MAYEYSSESKRLEFPNPFRVENQFYFMAAPILAIGGVLLLLMSRGHLAAHNGLWAFTPFAIGLFLLLRGLFYAAQAMSRLRFFFGRGQPRGLAHELTPDQIGSTPDADQLKEKLRQNSLFFPEPRGALNGLLYSLVRNLIYAPQRVQWVAQRQFQNGLAMLATLLSLLVTVVGLVGTQATGWLSLFYFLFTLVLLLKPLDQGAAGEGGLGLSGLVVLILVAILGPVLIPLVLGRFTAPDWVPGLGETALILLAGLAAVLLFFLAVIHQSLREPPTAHTAVRQDTLSMNAQPKQLMDELEREMQVGWVESVPNRRYARQLPELDVPGGSGSFRGELLEETQPVPKDDLRELGLAKCLGDTRYRWLGWLNIYGVGLMTVAVLLLIAFARSFRLAELDPTMVLQASLGLALFILGNFCFRAGNVLWGRFEFVSDLYWIEMAGNYQSARMEYGAPLGDRVRTQRDLVSVETMTLRVWAAQLETVSFGKDVPRAILGMRGLPDKAQYLHDHLARFGGNQSIIVAPTAERDGERIAALAGINSQSGTAPPAAVLVAQAQAQPSPVGQPQSLSGGGAAVRHCPACGTSVQPGARFCVQCGKPLGG